MVEFIGVIKHIGGSTYIRIDKKIAKKLNLRDGDLVLVRMYRVKIVPEDFDIGKKKSKKHGDG